LASFDLDVKLKCGHLHASRQTESMAGMKDAAKVFAIIVSIIVGGVLVYQEYDMLEPRFLFRSDLRESLGELMLGIVLLAGGLTGVWMMKKRSR